MIDAGTVAEADELNASEPLDNAVTGKVALGDAVISEEIVMLVKEADPVEDEFDITVGTLVAFKVGITVSDEADVAAGGLYRPNGVEVLDVGTTTAGGVLRGLFIEAGTTTTGGDVDESGASTGRSTSGGTVDEIEVSTGGFSAVVVGG